MLSDLTASPENNGGDKISCNCLKPTDLLLLPSGISAFIRMTVSSGLEGAVEECLLANRQMIFLAYELQFFLSSFDLTWSMALVSSLVSY